MIVPVSPGDVIKFKDGIYIVSKERINLYVDHSDNVEEIRTKDGDVIYVHPCRNLGNPFHTLH